MTLRFFLLPAFLISLLLGGCPASPPTPSVATSSASKSFPASPTAPPGPLETVRVPAGMFFTLPYLQLGESPSDAGAMAVVWHLPLEPGTNEKEWRIETRSPAGVGSWVTQTAPIKANRITVGGVKPHVVCQAEMSGLVPGQPFDYRLLKTGTPVFSARANRARPSPTQDYRMVIFGDCAEDTAWQKKVAYQTFLRKPDSVLITGDIVYPRGRASEYRSNYFPVYSAFPPNPSKGAPLLASTLFIGASGNHDLDYANLQKYPDGLAYYYYWKQPLNGWGGAGAGEVPPVSGDKAAFAQAAGKSYPAGANFSFDYGNTHFVVIDSNYYMNWRSPQLQDGLRKAITANPAATWRFVVFHVAPFHSSSSHQEEQWMRRLAPLFEECGVDVVWSGHVHNYQRSHPLRFLPTQAASNSNLVDGTFTLDTRYDGVSVTKPDGVLYIVTGAGGAALYPKRSTSDLAEYTAQYDAGVHSLTELSVHDKTLSVRQIDENGKKVDEWSVTK